MTVAILVRAFCCPGLLSGRIFYLISCPKVTFLRLLPFFISVHWHEAMKNDRRHSDESDESLQIVDDSDDNESDSDDEPESAEEEEEASEETSEDVSHDEDQKRPRRWKR